MRTSAHRHDVAGTPLRLAQEVNQETKQQHERNEEGNPGCQRSSSLIPNLHTLLREFLQQCHVQHPSSPVTQPLLIPDGYFIPIHIETGNILLGDICDELCEWHHYTWFLRLP